MTRRPMPRWAERLVTYTAMAGIILAVVYGAREQGRMEQRAVDHAEAERLEIRRAHQDSTYRHQIFVQQFQLANAGYHATPSIIRSHHRHFTIDPN